MEHLPYSAVMIAPRPAVYVPARPALSTLLPLRGLRYHVLQWGGAEHTTPERPPLVMLHGWMDVAASFQFVVDALAKADDGPRWVIAPDWRGFGLTEPPPGTDSYWFPDYLADLDALLDTLVPQERFAQIDLVGHSMGGNVAMSYAGVRPGRIRRLVNLEGFGMPSTTPEQAPKRFAQWLDALKAPADLRDYASAEAVAARLMKTNPLLPPDKAAWLALHWSRPGPDGRWRILGDPAHKRVNPVLYRIDEVLETWKCITAPLLWVDGDRTELDKWWGHRYSRDEFDRRLATVPGVRKLRLSPASHMLHHDQPEALALALVDFLRAPG